MSFAKARQYHTPTEIWTQDETYRNNFAVYREHYGDGRRNYRKGAGFDTNSNAARVIDLHNDSPQRAKIVRVD
jgi:hypothetical protein